MRITRRTFLGGSAATLALASCRKSPQVAADVPRITHGVQSGDVNGDTAQIWARCSETAHMLVEWSTTASFATPTRVKGPLSIASDDFTAHAELSGLPSGQTIHYRVKFDRDAARGESAWSTGRFVTPRTDRVRLAWTGDTCGQGFGRNPDWGGLKGYAAIQAARPDLFLNVGDLIYADNPILAEEKTHDGKIWKNVTNERVARVAQELEDFRARFAYNFEDEHVRSLAANVATVAQWDDHETHNNWWPGQSLDDPRYTKQKLTTMLAAFAKKAVREWTPIAGPTVNRVIHYGPLVDIFVLDLRTYRTANDANAGATGDMLGNHQVEWFIKELVASKATWKIIACDQPLALFIDDGPDGKFSEGYANNVPGAPSGREVELARVLKDMYFSKVANVVWLTADVHYSAHHAFDPTRANGITNESTVVFSPFHEFVAGPIHAGNFGPNPLDPTFGPEVKFQLTAPVQNAAPWDGYQTFGTVDATPDGLSVAIVGIDGTPRYTTQISRV